MSEPNDTPNLDDVIEPEEHPTRDRTQHAKDPHPSDEVLEHRTELERQAVGSDDADPARRRAAPRHRLRRAPAPGPRATSRVACG